MLEIIKEAFFSWLWLFGAPLKDINIIWIIVPIWVSWFFTEFFQEKRGTGFGNAITNGAVALWVSIDWFRYITNGLADNSIVKDYTLVVKLGLAGFILLFGIIVIIEGLQRKKFASFGGRIRVITYILVMFTPIIYETAAISTINIVSIFVFFPLYYLVLELVVFIVPDSKALEEDKSGTKENKSQNKDSQGSFDKPFKSDINSVGNTPAAFGQDQQQPYNAQQDPFAQNGQDQQNNNIINDPFQYDRKEETPKDPFVPEEYLPNTNNQEPINPQGAQEQQPMQENNQPQQGAAEFQEPDFEKLPEKNKFNWENINNNQ